MVFQLVWKMVTLSRFVIVEVKVKKKISTLDWEKFFFALQFLFMSKASGMKNHDLHLRKI